VIDAIPEVAVERVYYCAGSSFVTGSDIAQVLIDYARWVAVHGGVELIDIPTVGPDGTAGRTTVLLTATTQMSAETMYSAEPELADRQWVDRMRVEVSRLSSPMQSVAAESGSSSMEDAYDL
jgi:hypothetical protein